MKIKMDSKFDLFCFIKNVLVAANKAGWTHLPEHDRYIADQVTFAFSKNEEGKEPIELDLEFDLCEAEIVKSGVARWETSDGVRVVKGEDIIFVDIKDFFDPMKMITFGEFKKK